MALKTSMERNQERRKANELKRLAASLNRPTPPPTPNEPKIERQEIHCHNCNRYVQFDIDMGLDGQHVLNCPNCDHKHYRIVRNGTITAERWGRDPSQDLPTYTLSNITYTQTATYATASSGTSASYYYDSSGWSSTSTCAWAT